MRPQSFERWRERSPYRVLGVPPTATDAQIKRAYRAAAKANHPDRAGKDESAAAEMAEINAAFAVLKDRSARSDLDAFLAAPRSSSTSAGVPPPPPTSSLPWCARCGTTDATLRVVAFPTIVSLGVVTENAYPEILCEPCRSRVAATAALASVLLGWWAPGGARRTVPAVLRAWRLDPIADPARDALVLRTAAELLFRRGERDEARRALTASLGFAGDPGGERLLREWGGPLAPSDRGIFARAGDTGLRVGSPLMPFAVAGVVTGFVAWKAWPDPPPATVVVAAAPAPVAEQLAVDATDPEAVAEVNALNGLELRGHALRGELEAVERELAAIQGELVATSARVADLARDGVSEEERPRHEALLAGESRLAATQAEAAARKERLLAELGDVKAEYTRRFDALRLRAR